MFAITAVSGSDDKLGQDLGSSATAIYADELSRPAIATALRAGRAYVRTLGVHESPAVEIEAVTADGRSGTVGDTLAAPSAEVSVRVTGGDGQLLLLSRDGLPAGAVPITGDDWTHTFTADQVPTSGPLGTFWRVDTLVPASGSAAAHLSTIGNPFFLVDPTAPDEPAGPDATPPGPAVTAPGEQAATGPGRLPATGSARPVVAVGVLAVLALMGGALLRRARPVGR